MASVGTAISRMLRVNIFLRPTRSPKWAMIMPPEGLHLTQPLRYICREEELPHYGSEEDEDNEVVKLQRTA